MTPIILVFFALHGFGYGDTHGPCQHTTCPSKQVCKVRYSPCLITPCPDPFSQCTLTDKPGSCPPEVTIPGKCVRKCDTDADCPSSWKCCGMCLRECKPVYKETVKPGRCPPLSQCPDTLPYCPSTPRCQTDDDCAGSRKCCGKCPRLCIEANEDDD